MKKTIRKEYLHAVSTEKKNTEQATENAAGTFSINQGRREPTTGPGPNW
jgi:hypothetical protein